MRPNYKLREFKRNVPLFLMSLPGMLSILLFNYIPLFGIYMAFTNYSPRFGIFGSQFVGLDNFKYVFSSGDLTRAVGNTIYYHFAMEFAVTFAALVLSFLLYFIKSKRASMLYQKATVVPFMVSYVIIGYIVYIFLCNDYGLLNIWLENLGLQRVSWYMTPGPWRIILPLVNVWFGAGIKAVYYYAAMMGIDSSLFEAAILDGANRKQQSYYIILPEIMSTVCMFLITGLGNLLASDLALYQSVPMDSQALYPATDVMATYVYRGLVGGTYSVTTAVGLFTGIVALIGTLSVNYITKKLSPGSEMF